MADSNTERRGTVEQPADVSLPSDAIRIGTDGFGYTHWWSRITKSVYTIDEKGHPEKRYEVGSHSLGKWVNHISLERGWLDYRYAEDGIEALVERVAEEV